jgi:hypothetical protein
VEGYIDHHFMTTDDVTTPLATTVPKKPAVWPVTTHPRLTNNNDPITTNVQGPLQCFEGEIGIAKEDIIQVHRRATVEAGC